MNLTPQRKSAIAFSSVLSAVGFLAYSGLYSLSRLFAAFNALMGTNTDTSGLPKVACVFFIVYSCLIYTVVSRLFIRYNTPVRECWLAEHPEPMTGGQILAAMFRSPDFLVGLAVLFLLALPQWSAKSAITEFINYGKSYDASAARAAELTAPAATADTAAQGETEVPVFMAPPTPGIDAPAATTAPLWTPEPTPEATPVPTPKPVPEGVHLEQDMEGDLVKKVQRRLKDIGYLAGEVDGYYGEITYWTVWIWQGDNGLPVTGEVNDAEMRLLFPEEYE